MPGGLTFATPDDKQYLPEHVAPGEPALSASPGRPDKLGGKTVFRGGFGMFVAPITISQLQISGAYSTSPLQTQWGFSQSTTVVTTNDNNLTPAATLSDPFPSRAASSSRWARRTAC